MRRSHATLRWSLGPAAAVVMAWAAAAGAAPLSVRVVSVTTPVMRGTEGRLVVRTAPHARCGASVQALSDPHRTIASLPPHAAGADGLVKFSVRVPDIAKAGPYPVTVSCRRGEKAAVTHLRVTVQ